MSERPKWMPRLSPSEWHFEPTLRDGCLRAQIAVLEEMLTGLEGSTSAVSVRVENKLAALRKELDA